MLTALQVKSLKEGMHADGNGLYLKVQASGSRSWVFRYQLNGKRRPMGLGAFPAISLLDAREAATKAAKLLEQGIDPIDERNRRQSAEKVVQAEQTRRNVTFAEACDEFIKANRDGWKNLKHVQQWENTLATYSKSFSGKLVGNVTIEDLANALRPIWLTKAETASRFLDRVLRVMKFAKVMKWHSTNIIEWPENLRDTLLPKQPSKPLRVVHHPALPFSKVAEFMSEIRGLPGKSARALEFLILTAARSGEVRGARWNEIDLEAGLWKVPAERMKTKVAHVVPLSKQAIALLKSLSRDKEDGLIFEGQKPGAQMSDMTLTALLRRRNRKNVVWADDDGNPITAHGFRSTFRDWAAETTPFPSFVVEKALAHAVADKVEAAYRRGDLLEKRRQLMQAWAGWCEKSGSVVVAFAA